MQPDGHILAGGSFKLDGAFRVDLVRLDANGILETGFYPETNGEVDCVAVQADGEILLGGVFTSVRGAARSYIARVHADGTLDSVFDLDADGAIKSVTVQADGKILIGGQFMHVEGQARMGVARLNADGTVDASFAAKVNNFVNTVAVQPDGKILLGGQFTTVGGKWSPGIARVNSDGTPDSGFVSNGNRNVYCIAMQADGKILVGGSFTSIGGTTRNRIARLNSDGTLDAAFDPNANGEVLSVTVQADGQILAGGIFTTVSGVNRNHVVRINSDGTLDSPFDPDANGTVNAVMMQADGKILLGGGYELTSVGGITRNHIARLANSAATQTLATDGPTRAVWLRGGAAPEVSAVVFELSTDGGSTWQTLGDGTRISGGWEREGLVLPARGSLRARGRTTGGMFNGSSGLVEQVETFGGLTTAAPVVTAATSAAITSEGATLGGEVTSDGGSAISERGVVYAATVGNALPRIGGAGVTKVPVTGGTGAFTTTVTGLTDGTAYSYAAYATNSSGTTYTSVATFKTPPASTNADLSALTLSGGTLSPAFARGTTSYNASVANAIDSIAVTPSLTDPAASVMVNGSPVASSTPSSPIALASGINTITVRVTSRDGTRTRTYEVAVTRDSAPVSHDLDPNFAPHPNGSVFGLAVQPDGKILLGGDFTSVDGSTRNYIARANADGTLDMGFNPNADSAVFSIAVQGDGNVLLGGNFDQLGGSERRFIARVNADGVLDTSFNPVLSGGVLCMALQADGKILIGGSFTSVNGTTRNRVARLNANGTLDYEFNPSANSTVDSIAVQTDGRILLGGPFTTMAGAARHYIARVNPDGTLDTAFDPSVGSITNSSLPVQTIVVQGDGRILLGGQLTSVNGVTRNHIARLNTDGALDSAFDPNANSDVLGVAIQADGKIVLVGSFSNISGVSRKGLARLYADGRLDLDFAPNLFVPNLNGAVHSLALQADGQVLLVSGSFAVAGTAYNNVSRLTNEAATQTLVASSASRVEWLRDGGAPEVSAVTFELSSDGGSTWSVLGAGTRSPGGWELNGVALPGSGWLRARGRANSGGFASGNSGLVEQVQAFPIGVPVLAPPTDVGVTTTAATLGSEVTFDGNSTVTERGIVYAPTGINSAPQNGGSGVMKVVVTGTTGVFTARITGLTPGTDYSYAAYATNAFGTTFSTVASFVTKPSGVTALPGDGATFMAPDLGAGGATGYEWRRNGAIVVGESGASLRLSNVQPRDAGLYSVDVANATTTINSTAILGVSITGKVEGDGDEIDAEIIHPNGNVFDQVLLTGTAETITADAGQVTRTSFIDLDDDIVQVEFSGAGSLSLVLDGQSGPAAPINYTQPTVSYVKGHAGIVIVGANETTNVSVFSVGRATAFDPTGHYDLTKSISAANDPAKNGNPLFVGHETTSYDGVADIEFIAISSKNGKFGSIRTANANYFALRGLTGVYAPGVQFVGPIFVGNIDAFGTATPVIQVGSANDVRITGGDLFQDAHVPVQVSGVAQLKFTDGSDSHGNKIAAKVNEAVLQQNGIDVTSEIVVGP